MSDLLFYHRPQTCIESKVLPLGQNDPTFVSGTITSNESSISSCYSEAKQNFSGWVSNVLVWKWHMKSWTFIHSWGYGTEILSTTVRQAMQSSTVMAVWQYSCHWLKLWHNPSFIENILFFFWPHWQNCPCYLPDFHPTVWSFSPKMKLNLQDW